MKKNSYKINKNRLYHKLINNKLVYDNKALNRYKNVSNNNSLMNKNGKENLLSDLKDKIKSIRNCELKKNATNLVFSDGNPFSKIMIIGEGPGANEDKEGKPFVGRAGKLLDKMLESIKLNRKNVYISNVVNFRPPQNRKPTDEEITRYLPFLKKHIISKKLPPIYSQNGGIFIRFKKDMIKDGGFIGKRPIIFKMNEIYID